MAATAGAGFFRAPPPRPGLRLGFSKRTGCLMNKPMSSKTKIRRLDEHRVGLMVIDLQERFAPLIDAWPGVVQSAVRLIRFFRLIQAPILATEQYPRGLGKTVPEVLSELEGAQVRPVEKTSFSCCGAPGFVDSMTASGRTQWVLCGIETHVCV